MRNWKVTCISYLLWFLTPSQINIATGKSTSLFVCLFGQRSRKMFEIIFLILQSFQNIIKTLSHFIKRTLILFPELAQEVLLRDRKEEATETLKNRKILNWEIFIWLLGLNHFLVLVVSFDLKDRLKYSLRCKQAILFPHI